VEGRRGRGREGGRKEGMKNKIHTSFPIPVLFKKGTESLGRWWIWMRSKLCTRYPLNESSVRDKKVLGGVECCVNEEGSTTQDGR